MLRKILGSGSSSSIGNVVNAVKLDGTNDYLTRGGALTGVVDSSTGIFSCWFRPDNSIAGNVILSTPSSSFQVAHSVSGARFTVRLTDTASTNYMRVNSANSYMYPTAQWYNLLISWNTNAASGARTFNIYVNDVSDKSISADVGAAFLVHYADTDFYVSASNGKVDGCLSELYFAPGQYLDFSVTANRRKFIDANGKPVSLGSTGATPTGTAPAIYLKGDKTNFGTNSGTGGNFTVNGALETASTTPSDASINAVKYDGSTGYLSKASAIYGSNSSQGILSAWIRLDANQVGGNGAALLYEISSVIIYAHSGVNKVSVLVKNGASIYQITSSAYNFSPDYVHVLAAWDTNFAAGNKVGYLYINGASDKTVASDASSAFSVPYSTASSWFIANTSGAGSSRLNGAISELYFAPGQFLDLSVASNRAKFIDASGNPVYLGANGELPTGTAPAIYLNNRAALIGTNKGTGGNFTVNGTITDANSTPLYYYSEPAKFDGSSTYLGIASVPTGLVDGSRGTLSAFVRLDGSDGVQQYICRANSRFNFYRSAANKFEFELQGNTGTTLLNFNTTGTYTASPVWVHILASWDTNYSAGNKIAQLYVSNVSVANKITDTSPAGNINYNASRFNVGATSVPNLYFNGCISDLYFSNRFIDITQASNRAKFIDQTTLRPVFLGKDGSLPDGTAPLIYLANSFNNFQNNLGTGGNFTVTGALTRGTTSASDVRS